MSEIDEYDLEDFKEHLAWYEEWLEKRERAFAAYERAIEYNRTHYLPNNLELRSATAHLLDVLNQASHKLHEVMEDLKTLVELEEDDD